MRQQCLAMPHAVDADDEAEAARSPGFNTGGRILDHDRPFRRYAQPPRGLVEGIGRGFAPQP